jgi:pimeloyl-ACP methyl ester carboxylesterase
VFTHGYCLSLRCWVFQRRALKAAGYRVVSWDHRGHGKSGRGERDSYVIDRLAKDLHTVIDQVAPTGDLVLVGHSMGGMTIMALGELDPALIRDRVIGAAFVSTSPGGITLANGGRSATIGRLLLERLGPAVLTPLSERPDLWTWLRRSSATLEEFLVDRNSFASPVAASLVRFTGDILLGTPLDVINDYLATFDGFDIRPSLKYFRGVNVLVFNGKDDILTPPEHSDLIVEGIPGAEHVLVNDAGHVIMLEHPDLLNAQLTQLIERAVRSRAGHLEVSQQPRVRRTVTNVAKERRARASRPPRRARAEQARTQRGA